MLLQSLILALELDFHYSCITKTVHFKSAVTKTVGKLPRFKTYLYFKYRFQNMFEVQIENCAEDYITLCKESFELELIFKCLL